MQIGVPREIKNNENRVGLTPSSVRELVALGHVVKIEKNAGYFMGYTDQNYEDAGANIVQNRNIIYKECSLIVKVKEPLPEECILLNNNQIIFTFLHLAADKKQAELLMKSQCIAIAYETITNNKGELSLLTPMSEVAGRIAVQKGAQFLEKDTKRNGQGILLGGLPGVPPANVVVIGAGSAGLSAIKIAKGFGACVTVLDIDVLKLQYLENLYFGSIRTVVSTSDNVRKEISKADLVIGAVLIPGAKAPKIITRDMLKIMKKHSVIIDIAVDQGGFAETTRKTDHDNPTYIEEGVIHYGVTNMPSLAAKTATLALNNASLPFIKILATEPLTALRNNKNLRNGLNIYKGKITNNEVAKALNLPFYQASELLNK